MSAKSIVMAAAGTSTGGGSQAWTYRGDQFVNVNNININNDVIEAQWNGSVFVVIGSGGAVSTSPDGVTWTSRTGLIDAGATGYPNNSDLLWANSQFVYIADHSQPRLFTSPDGITWTNRSSSIQSGWGASKSPTSIAWNGSIYCAVGRFGDVATSPDAITWTDRPGLRSTAWGTSADCNNIIWDGSRFVVVGNTGKLATSTDGINWTNSTTLSSSSWSTNNARGVVFHNSLYIVVGAGGVFSSPNLLTWTARDISTNQLFFIRRLGSLYFSGGSSGVARVSSDGLTWQDATLSTANWDTAGVLSAAYNGSNILVVGAVGQAATSTDGTTWTYQDGLSKARSIFNNYTVNAVIWTGSLLVACGYNGRIATSPNGTAWTYRDNLTKNTSWTTFGFVFSAFAVAKSSSVYCVGGAAGKVATSSDAITWTYQSGLRTTTWGTAADVSGMAWNGSLFCAVGSGGRAATSPDGVTWTYSSGLSGAGNGSRNLYGVVFLNSLFYAFGTGGISSSANGSNWTFHGNPFGVGTIIYSIAWSGSVFCAVAQSGKVATSTNGTTWTVQTGLSSTQFGTSWARSVAWNGTLFCVVGDSGKAATSPDGVTWTYQPGLLNSGLVSTSTPTATSLVWADDKFVVVGTAFIATSP